MQNENMISSLRRATGVVFVLTEIAAIVIAFFLGLTDQEAYYWSWSKFPDFSYFDHPPVQAWVTAFLTGVFGDHAWVVRCPAILGRFAAVYLIYLIGKKIYDERVGLLAALFAMGSFLLILGSVVAIPDVIATPLCLLAIYCTECKKPRAAAAAVGLAVLSKWTSLFITPVLLYRFWKQGLSWRRLLTEIIGIPVLIQAPVIWWNIQHDFITVKFHLIERQEHAAWPLARYFHNFSVFFQSQLFCLGFAGLALLAFAFMAKLLSSAPASSDEEKQKDWQTLLWTIPGFVIVGISGVGGGEIRFYWTNISILLLDIVLVAFVLRKKEQWAARMMKWAAALTATSWILILLAVLIPFGAMINQMAGRIVYNRPSLMSDLTQWPTWVKKSLTEKDLKDPNLVFVASDIHIASQLTWILGKENILRVRVAGPHQNQFGIWQEKFPKVYERALFLADFRFENRSVFNGLCATPLEWHTEKVVDDGYQIGEIYSARCDQLKN
jgi:hypothetical protein